MVKCQSKYMRQQESSSLAYQQILYEEVARVGGVRRGQQVPEWIHKVLLLLEVQQLHEGSLGSRGLGGHSHVQ